MKEVWYVFYENQLSDYFSTKDISFLLEEKFINPLYKDIYTATPPSKPIEKLWKASYKKHILAVVANKEFWNNYYLNVYFSFYHYINKEYMIDFEKINILNGKRTRPLHLEWLWNLSCNIDKQLSQDKIKILSFDNISLNISSEEYVLRVLFDKNPFNKNTYNIEDIKIFLRRAFFKKENFKNIFIRKWYIVQNIHSFCLKNKIFNETLNVLFAEFNLEAVWNSDNAKSIHETWTTLRMKRMIDEVIKYTKTLENSFDWDNHLVKFPEEDIKKNIILHKNSDIYHSTTIEGYHTDMDEVKFINEWILPNYLETPAEKETYIANIENKAVLKSYKRALEMILDDYLCKEKDLWKEDLVKINYFEFIEGFEQQNKKLSDHNYRNHIVRMNGCEGFLPPETIWEIDALVDYLFEKLKEINNYLLKGIACHFLLVPIQPFWDGNWRLSRFVMNILFSFWGYKWVTIDKHDYRLLFLSSYGLSEDYKYQEILDIYRKFINFILHYVDWKLKIEKNEKS